MPNLYLTSHYYQAMPLETQKVPRERFIRYYNDLFDLEGVTRPLISDYMVEGQYDFATLGEAVLKPAKILEDLSHLDLFVVAYWGHEFDPDGSFGAYFSHQYGIQSTLFDICDKGILSPIMALQLIMAYAKQGKVKNAALLCVDQRAIPVEANFTGTLPVKSSARLLFFSTKKREITNHQLLSAAVDQKKIDRHQHASMQSIVIEPDSPYYSSAELFSPLFDQAFINPKCNEVCLSVIDAESNCEGSLLFKRMS